MSLIYAGLNITEAQRARWASLMMDAAAEVGMPEAFLQSYVRFVAAITGSVRENSNMPMDEMRAMLGLPVDGGIWPLKEEAPRAS